MPASKPWTTKEMKYLTGAPTRGQTYVQACMDLGRSKFAGWQALYRQRGTSYKAVEANRKAREAG